MQPRRSGGVEAENSADVGWVKAAEDRPWHTVRGAVVSIQAPVQSPGGLLQLLRRLHGGGCVFLLLQPAIVTGAVCCLSLFLTALIHFKTAQLSWH